MIPQNWINVKVKNIASVKGGKRLPKGSKYVDEITSHPYIRVTDFDKLSINQNNLRYIDENTFNQISRYIISKEDLYISIAGTIGKVGKIPNNLDKANLTENAAKITEIVNFNQDFLIYQISSINVQSQIKNLTKMTSQPKLALYRIGEIEVLQAPLNEQHRIVAKIEELFTKLDTAVAELKNVKTQLKRYRQSVLKAAFECKLTEEWSGEKNLQEWKESKFVDFCKLQRGYDLPIKKIIEGKYPVITSSGIKGYHNEHRAKGPCLITGRSGSVGNVFYYDIELFWPHNTTLFVKDFCENFPKFVYYFFLQFNFQKFSASTAVPTLDRKQLYNEIVFIPSIKEQKQVVEEIESRLSVSDKIETEIESSIKKAEQLRQSILKKAFEGKLVPQDPNDPPASELLEKIKKERRK